MFNRPYYIKQVSAHRWALVGPTFSKLFTYGEMMVYVCELDLSIPTIVLP